MNTPKYPKHQWNAKNVNTCNQSTNSKYIAAYTNVSYETKSNNSSHLLHTFPNVAWLKCEEGSKSSTLTGQCDEKSKKY